MSKHELSKIFIGIPCLSSEIHLIDGFLTNHSSFNSIEYCFIFKVNQSSQISRKISTSLNYSIICMPDKSLYEAWNQIIEFVIDSKIQKSTSSNFLMFLGLDDLLIFESYKALLKNKKINEFDLIFGDAIAYLPNTERKVKSSEHPSLIDTTQIKRQFDIIHPGSLINIEIIGNLRFNTKYILAGDLDFYIELAKKKLRYLYFEDILVRIGSQGISHGKKSKRIYLKEFRKIEKAHQVKLNITLEFYLKVLLERFGLTNLKLRSYYWKLIQKLK